MTTPFHVQVLNGELERRTQRNPRYSVRAYAKGLGLHASAMCRILAGKQPLSLPAASKILDKLTLDADARRRFLQSVRDEHTTRIAQKIGRLTPNARLEQKPVEVDIETFEAIADFHHVAILESMQLAGDEPRDARWLSAKLGMPEAQVEEVLGRLVAAGLLERKGGRYVKAHKHLTTKDRARTSAALRRHQRQVMLKAIESLDRDPIEERCMVTMAVPADPEVVAEVKRRVDRFLEEMSDLLEAEPRGSLYQLNVQFFPVIKR